MNTGRNFSSTSENQFYLLFSNYFSISTLKEEKVEIVSTEFQQKSLREKPRDFRNFFFKL